MDLFKNLQAMPGKMIGEVLEKEEKVLQSGIVLTGQAVNQAMDDFRRAKVLSSGIDGIEAGDVVVYLRFVGSAAGDNHIVLETNDIIGKEV